MNTKQAIRASADLSRMVLKSYISDLEDADLLRRPGPDCNHLAWQLGHLISSECMLLEMVKPGAAAELPAASPTPTTGRMSARTTRQVPHQAGIPRPARQGI